MARIRNQNSGAQTTITATQDTTACRSTANSRTAAREDDREREQHLEAEHGPVLAPRHIPIAAAPSIDAVRRRAARRRDGWLPWTSQPASRRRALATTEQGGEDGGDGDCGRPFAAAERFEAGAHRVGLRPGAGVAAAHRGRAAGRIARGRLPARGIPGRLRLTASSSAGRGSPRTLRSASGAYGFADPTPTPSSSLSSLAAASGSGGVGDRSDDHRSRRAGLDAPRAASRGRARRSRTTACSPCSPRT